MLAPGPQGFIDRLTEPERLPDWLTEAELDYYAEEFSRTGFTGALNWYRNFDRNWEIMAHPVAESITVPCLFIGGTADPVLGFTRTDRAREVVLGPYRQVMLDGAGHWIQQERAEDINTDLLSFLSELRWK
jgi:pimeloyl-ACP methyl ester carboxylesterase